MKNIYKGDLIITIENQNNFKDITEVSGYVDVRANATFTAPKLEKSGYVDVRANATFTAPKLEKSGYVDVSENATFTAPKLEKSGSVSVSENATFTAPKLEKSGSVYVSENATFTAPKLEKSGSVDVRANATFTAPKLEKSGYVYVRANATFTAPKLEKSGSVDVRANATFTAPKLEKSGYVYVSENATFTAPKLTVKNNIAKFNNKEFKVIHNDGIMFIVESEKTSKGIKIHSGILTLKINNNIVEVTERGFVAEKEDYSAHGSTLKTAINDLQFKIVAEKLRKEPITADTEISVMYYRTVTGACDLGCREFMRSNKIPFKVENDRTIEEKPIKAKDLLPILEKSNAYGVSKFKELIQF